MTSTLSNSATFLNNNTTSTSSTAMASSMEKTSTHSTSASGGGGTPFTDDEPANHVTKLRENDVLLGRGGGTNNHSGNVKFRKLVNEHKLRYLAASKVDKPKVAREVVQLWRQMNPPGRFLTRHDEDKKEKTTEENTIWYDVGDKKANAKASQCLRERTPEVMPYLRQLREQQDLSTEQGVMMVRQHQQQQQQQQHQQAAQQQHQQQGGAAPASYGADPYSPHAHHPHHQGAGAYPPMAPSSGHMMSNNGMSPHHPMRAHMSPHGPPTMSPHGRRTSAPHLPGPPAAYSPRTAQPHQGMANMPPGSMYSSHHPSNMSPRHANMAMQGGGGGGMPPGPPLHASPTGTGQGYYSAPSPPGAPPLADAPLVDPMDPTVAAYYGDMTDLEYEQSMMIMQQQLEMQQMQLRRMQQQRAMQRAVLGSGGSGHGPSSVGAYESSSGSGHSSTPASRPGLSRQAGNFPQANGTLTMAASGGNSGYPATNNSNNNNTRVPHQPPAKMTSPGATTNQQATGAGGAAREAPDANARKPKRTLSMTRPERTSSGLSALRADMAHDLPAMAEHDGELTLEEYRQQLEAYISNTQHEDKDGGLGGGGDIHDNNDDGEASDLEDDWEKERDKHMNASFARRTPNRGVSRTRSRGVDRAKSGASFMSIGTMKSATGMSVVSGFSNLSDLMSAADEGNEGAVTGGDDGAPSRTRKGVDRTVSNQSNLSMMSELTDLSANIDNLSLYED